MISITSLTAYLQQHAHLAYFVLFFGSYFETLIGINFFVFGEIFFLSGAILAGLGYLNIWLVSLACILGGIAGDSSSYYIGRRYGRRFMDRIFREGNRLLSQKNYKRGERAFRKYGTKSIFFARLLGPLSWVTPFLAGTLQVPYREFLIYNIPGVILGIGEFMLLGYFFGFAYTKFLPVIGEYALIGMLVLLVGGIGFLLLRRLIKEGA